MQKPVRKAARRFVVSGRVQGVGYRAFAEHAAKQTGVTGWVRNLDSGDVEAQACGQPSQVDDFEALLWKGPPWAEIRAVRSEEIAFFLGAISGSGIEPF